MLIMYLGHQVILNSDNFYGNLLNMPYQSMIIILLNTTLTSLTKIITTNLKQTLTSNKKLITILL